MNACAPRPHRGQVRQVYNNKRPEQHRQMRLPHVSPVLTALLDAAFWLSQN